MATEEQPHWLVGALGETPVPGKRELLAITRSEADETDYAIVQFQLPIAITEGDESGNEKIVEWIERPVTAQYRPGETPQTTELQFSLEIPDYAEQLPDLKSSIDVPRGSALRRMNPEDRARYFGSTNDPIGDTGILSLEHFFTMDYALWAMLHGIDPRVQTGLDASGYIYPWVDNQTIWLGTILTLEQLNQWFVETTPNIAALNDEQVDAQWTNFLTKKFVKILTASLADQGATITKYIEWFLNERGFDIARRAKSGRHWRC